MGRVSLELSEEEEKASYNGVRREGYKVELRRVKRRAGGTRTRETQRPQNVTKANSDEETKGGN